MLFLCSTNLILSETKGSCLRAFNCSSGTSWVMHKWVILYGNLKWTGTPKAYKRWILNYSTCTSSPYSQTQWFISNSFRCPLLFITYKSGRGRPFILSTASPLQKGEAKSRLSADSVILLHLEISKAFMWAILSQLARNMRKLSPMAIPLSETLAFFILDF